MSLRSSPSLYQRRGNRIVTAPTSEPVFEPDLLTYLSVDIDDCLDEDPYSYITMARQFIEDELGIAMITQTWLVALDRWPSGREPWWDGVRQGAISELTGPYRSYELPRFPLVSIDTVNVYDEASNATAVNVANTFDVDTYNLPGRMTLRSGAAWPVALRASNAIEITYTAGYGAAEDVPAPLKHAVKQLAGYLYDHRGGCDLNEAFEKSGASAMVARYAVARI